MNSGRVLAIIILLFGAGYFWMGTQIHQPPTVIAVGPRVFPLAIGIGLVCSALWLFGWPGNDASVANAEKTVADEVAIPFDWLRVGGLLLLLIGYIALFQPLGYIVSTALFMFGGSQLLGERKTWLRDGLLAILLVVVISFVFARLLGINLPDGLVGW